jgi:hypothetical protein
MTDNLLRTPWRGLLALCEARAGGATPQTGKGTLDLPRLWIAAIVTALVLLGLVPAVAQANVTASSITSWVTVTTDAQGHKTVLTNAPYVVSFDNPPTPTTVTVSGTAMHDGTNERVDIECFFGSSSTPLKLGTVAVTGGPPDGTFSVGPVALRPWAGHACRLRAVPTGTAGPGTDVATFAGPQVAVSEVALPSGTVGGKQYDFSVNAMTFTGNAEWTSAGSTSATCGPAVAPLDPQFDIRGNFAINCAGSLQGRNVANAGDRSEVRVDGQNAYDAASAQGLLGSNVDLQHFPTLSASVDIDPNTGSATSQSFEGWVVCQGLTTYPPTADTCPTFTSAGVQLERDITTSAGGDVITMRDTWTSTDGNAHSLDLLYDDSVGATTFPTQRGYEFPGQGAFTAYGSGDSLPSPGTAPGSILVRSNLAAPDGATSEAAGAITFSTPPSGFTFVNNAEFQEHQVVQVPATGSTSLTYIYSSAFTVAQTQALALAAQDRLQPLAVSVTAPANGATTTASPVTITGTATAGSGIGSLVVGGQTVPVEANGTWSADVPLNPGSNTIGILATDAAGNAAQGQLTVAYQPPAPPPQPLTVKCRVPRTKGMKLPAAERALRRAHCRVGRIKHVSSKKIRKGRVMGTTPRAGRRLAAGAKIQVSVSKGA